MLFVGAVLLYLFDVLPDPWGIVVVGLAAVVEVAETWFWIWLSRRRRVQAGPETLIGAPGVTVGGGVVRVEGELWQSRGAEALAPGAPVRVVSRDGLLLEVESETGEASPGQT